MPDDRSECGRIRALLVWEPAGDLAAEDRRLVESHVSGCTACAEMLLFARAMKRETGSIPAHPGPETLVAFCEDRQALDPATCKSVERHIASCRECGEEAGILGAIDRDLAEADRSKRAGRRRPLGPAGTREARPWWREVRGLLWRPVPAVVVAGILLAAVLAGLLLDRIGPGPGSGAGIEPVRTEPFLAGGVAILSDYGGDWRGAGEPAEEAVPVLRGDQAQILVLELANLSAPPAPGEAFAVEIVASVGGKPLWSGRIAGSLLQESYAFSLRIGARALSAGRYETLVKDPRGRTVFRSAFRIGG